VLLLNVLMDSNSTTTMVRIEKAQNTESSFVRPCPRRPFRRGFKGVCLLIFLSLWTALCQERPSAPLTPSMTWHVQDCSSAWRALHPTSVAPTGAPSLANCSKLGRLMNFFPHEAESSSADTRLEDAAVEAAPPISSAPFTENKTPTVEWTPLMHESSFYLGVMHGFRLATEPSTRKAMGNKPFGYFAALGAMHGWSDGDGYYENYLGHPIQGAVSDYMWIHNDLRYRNVEFGKSRDYWMSRLRAYAYSWVFSEQFEIGLFSEASLGQIQRYCCAYGFVDHVVTPNFGMIWLVGGDIIDRYVTRPLENRTSSVKARSILRGVINPPQSFANILALRYPWHRENRPDYDGQLYLREESANLGTFMLPLVPKFELTAAMPSYTRMGPDYCLGGSGVGAFRLSDFWQWTLEVGGCTLGNSLPHHWSGDSLIFHTGPQWIMHNSSRWSPHAHFRVGGQKITEEYCAVPEKSPGGLIYGTPCKSEPNQRAQHYESTGFSISTGAGLDVKLNSALAIRVANLDYMYSWLHPVAGTDYNQGVRFTTGLVLRIGTW
jgi:hypothetical protein